MNDNKRQYIHELFKTKNNIQLYQSQTAVIQQMLLIDNQKDFEDFLQYNDLDETIFWLHYSVIQGESLLIRGYDEDISKDVAVFLKKKLPKELFYTIEGDIQHLYVCLGDYNNIEKQIAVCNQHLKNTKYSIQLCYDETYCAGVYFLKVNIVG